MLTELIAEGHAGSFIQYRRAVKPEGNARALEIMREVFEVIDADWRGLGSIKASGLQLRNSRVETPLFLKHLCYCKVPFGLI